MGQEPAGNALLTKDKLVGGGGGAWGEIKAAESLKLIYMQASLNRR